MSFSDLVRAAVVRAEALRRGYALEATARSAVVDQQSALVALAAPLVVLLAFVLRVVGLTQSPYGFFADEASAGLDAYSIAHTLHDQHGVFLPAFFQSLGEWLGGFHIYWAVPFIALLGLSEFAIRFASAEGGAITVALVYLFVSRAFDRRTALVAALLLAIAPWHLIQSRIGWQVWDVPFVTGLWLTFFYLGLKHPRWLPVSFAVLAIGVYTYFPGRLFFPLMGIALMAIYARPLWEHKYEVTAGLGVAIVLLIPTLIAFHDGTLFVRFNQTKPASAPVGVLIAQFWSNYVAHFGPGFLFQTSTDWITRHYVRGFGMLYLFEAPFLVVGLVTMLLRRTRADLLILAWLLIYPLPAALVGPPISTRSITGVIAVQVVAAVGIMIALEWLNGVGRWLLRPELPAAVLPVVAAALLLIVSAGGTIGFMRAYLVDYPRYSSGWDGWQWGSQQIAEYFHVHSGDYTQEVMNADFNAPDELLTYYEKVDHFRCSTCTITNVLDQNAFRSLYRPNDRQLWAVSPDSLRGSLLSQVPYRVVNSISYPNHQTAFLFLATGPSA